MYSSLIKPHTCQISETSFYQNIYPTKYFILPIKSQDSYLCITTNKCLWNATGSFLDSKFGTTSHRQAYPQFSLKKLISIILELGLNFQLVLLLKVTSFTSQSSVQNNFPVSHHRLTSNVIFVIFSNLKDKFLQFAFTH